MHPGRVAPQADVVAGWCCRPSSCWCSSTSTTTLPIPATPLPSTWNGTATGTPATVPAAVPSLPLVRSEPGDWASDSDAESALCLADTRDGVVGDLHRRRPLQGGDGAGQRAALAVGADVATAGGTLPRDAVRERVAGRGDRVAGDLHRDRAVSAATTLPASDSPAPEVTDRCSWPATWPQVASSCASPPTAIALPQICTGTTTSRDDLVAAEEALAAPRSAAQAGPASSAGWPGRRWCRRSRWAPTAASRSAGYRWASTGW